LNNVFFSWKKKFLNNWPPILALLIQNDKIVNIVNVTGLLHYLTGKTQKLKRAKEEAQAEIRSYREEREKQFMDYQREVSKCFVKAQDCGFILRTRSGLGQDWIVMG